MLVYLAGPMRGVPYFNFPAFHAAAQKLRNQGYSVFNPAARDEIVYGDDIANSLGDVQEAVRTHKFDIRATIHYDMEVLTRHADAIALLPGWSRSNGARAEYYTAKTIGLQVILIEGAEGESKDL